MNDGRVIGGGAADEAGEPSRVTCCTGSVASNVNPVADHATEDTQ